MTIGERVQAARKAAGLSQRELGEKLGVSASMIGQYENNLRKPKLETLARIAKALNTYVSELIEPEHWKELDMPDAFSDLTVSAIEDRSPQALIDKLPAVTMDRDDKKEKPPIYDQKQADLNRMVEKVSNLRERQKSPNAEAEGLENERALIEEAISMLSESRKRQLLEYARFLAAQEAADHKDDQ